MSDDLLKLESHTLPDVRSLLWSPRLFPFMLCLLSLLLLLLLFCLKLFKSTVWELLTFSSVVESVLVVFVLVLAASVPTVEGQLLPVLSCPSSIQESLILSPVVLLPSRLLPVETNEYKIE